MPDSEPATPFIPPRPDIGTPSGSSPAVLPSVIPMSPSQSSSSSHPALNPFYSPYTGTPFIPPPMAPPDPIICRPSNYPTMLRLRPQILHPVIHLAHNITLPVHPTGHQSTTGYQTPYGMSQGLVPSPWSAAMSTPFGAFGAFAPPLPPTNPPGAAPGPYSTPAPQFTMQPGYPMTLAYATPWGPPMAFAQPAPPPPPPAAPPRQPERMTRAERYDKIGHFAVGPHYGPVLEPILVKAVGATLKVNPLLLPLDDEERPHLRWNMLFSTAHCHRSTDPTHRSWSNGRQEPATFPRVTEVRLVSRVFPWTVNVHATNRAVGITCGDLVEQLSDHLQRRLRKEDYESASGARRRAIRDAYHHNRSRSAGVPGGQLGDGLKALDWLGTQTMFGGVRQNEQLLLERFNVAVPCMLELVCVERPLVGDDEPEDTRHSRRRSRHMSTSRPSSRLDRDSSSGSRE
ncbi:hypothetical protein F5148DRAFT_1150473 [Russula earlei]|uniref:Uncharacterized protein n=1 Tax=Russula earlei TaxID=71964 RepID=A0ACC0U5N8_9AGAM|nr:hypothetical protein F5148DRAFT_1150473 [Russula earlei]